VITNMHTNLEIRYLGENTKKSNWKILPVYVCIKWKLFYHK
jgi:hypothetical protein